MTTLGWVLNLDAELELAAPCGYAPTATVRARVAAQGARFLAIANERATPTVRHVELDDSVEVDGVRAWSPTPTALARIAAAGHAPPAAPPLEVLQRVNHRRFAAQLAACLPGGAFVDSLAAFDAHVAAHPMPPGGWLAKRPFGFSGRGRKRIADLSDAATRRWVEASMHDYGVGLMVEPFVDIVEEFGQHGRLHRDGAREFGRLTCTQSDPTGAWLRSAVSAQTLRDLPALREAAHVVADALHAAGYFGPFAIDAYRWRDAAGHEHFQPLGELNARFSMGFFVGFDAG